MVEFALVLVLMLLLLGGVIEFGRAFWYYDAMAKATRDGARSMSMADVTTIVAAKGTAENMVADAVRAAGVPGVTSVQVTCLGSDYVTDVGCQNGIAPEYVRVAVSVTLGNWFPILLPTGELMPFTPTLAPSTIMRYMGE